MSQRLVRAVPLSVEAFAPFGQVVSAGVKSGSDANQGTATRFDFCAELVSTRPEAKPNLAVFRAMPRALPLDLVLLERHPCSTQVFIPMNVTRYLVAVAPTRAEDGLPDVSGLRVFVCTGAQGIAYAPGTWHHPMLALDQPSDFSMLAWEDGGPRDCEVQKLDAPIRVEL